MSVVDGIIGKYMKINPHIHHIYIRINKKSPLIIRKIHINSGI